MDKVYVFIIVLFIMLFILSINTSSSNKTNDSIIDDNIITNDINKIYDIHNNKFTNNFNDYDNKIAFRGVVSTLRHDDHHEIGGYNFYKNIKFSDYNIKNNIIDYKINQSYTTITPKIIKKKSKNNKIK
jgi:hypothetical protein